MPFYVCPQGDVHFLDDAASVDLLPEGCREVPSEEVNALLAGLNAPNPTLSELEVAEFRACGFADTTWRIDRDTEEKELGLAPTYTEAQMREILVFRQALRDILQHPAYPSRDALPTVPAFILEEVRLQNESRSQQVS